MRIWQSMTLTAAMTIVAIPVTAEAKDNLTESLNAIQQVSREGGGHRKAIQAWQQISKASAEQLPAILAGMPNDNPLADNWIRAAVDAIAERTLASGRKLPNQQLDAFLADRSHSPRSRRLAFEWLTKVDPSAHDRWILKLLDDPSLELRREAVARQLELAKQTSGADAIALYRTALEHARDVDQIDVAAEALRESGQEVNLVRHFGFIANWHLIGPFDNTDTSGYDKVYAPETEIDFNADYPGKEQVVSWRAFKSTDEYGLLDLNEMLGKHKGSLAYAFATFNSSEAREVELRLGCINANRVWLNGDVIIENHVYHSGRGIDQYTGSGKLRKGPNSILVKICQNEQTESWAQDWQFQLRVCDQLGTAVLPLETKR